MSIRIRGSYNVVISNSKFHGEGLGIDSRGNNGIQVINCEFIAEQSGVQCVDDRNVTIKGSRFLRMGRRLRYIGDYGCIKNTISAVVELNLNLVYVTEQK